MLRRNFRRIYVAGSNDGGNKAQRQKGRRPEGLRAQDGLALLLPGRRPAGGMLPRRAWPDWLGHEDSILPNYQAGPNGERVCNPRD